MIILIVCLSVGMVLMLGMLKLALTERRSVQSEERAVQADWLAAAGLDRAAAALGADAAYAGETWNIPAESLGRDEPASVTIEIATLDDRPTARKLTVRAELAPSSDQPIQRTRTIVIDAATTAD